MAIVILLSTITGILADLKTAICSQSLTFEGHIVAACPLGPSYGAILLPAGVAGLALIAIMSYATSKVHQFALWRGIATVIISAALILLAQTLIGTNMSR